MIYISQIYTTAPKKGKNPTEDKTFALLEKLHIPYERVENDIVETMEECKEIDKALGTEIRKSIFLCNQKKTSFFLVVLPADKQLEGRWERKSVCPNYRLPRKIKWRNTWAVNLVLLLLWDF